MRITREVLVFDAKDLHEESRFRVDPAGAPLLPVLGLRKIFPCRHSLDPA